MRVPTKLLASVAVAALLSGCVSDSAQQPRLATVADIRQDAALVEVEAGAAPLSRIVSEAEENNPILMKASAELRQAEGRVAGSLSSLSPSVDAILSAAQSENPTGASSDSTTSKKAGFSLRWVLWDGRYGGVAGAKAAESAALLLSAQGLIHMAKEEVAQQVVAAAVAEARAKERMDLADWNAARMEELGAVAARHAKAGVGFAADVAKAKVRIASAKTAKAVAVQQWTDARTELARLTGGSDSLEGRIDPPADTLPKDVRTAVAKARAASPGVIAAQAKIDALRAMRKASFIDGTEAQVAISVGPLGVATGLASGGLLTMGSIGLDIVQHVLDGAKTESILLVADGQIQAALSEAVSAQRQVEANVKKAWSAKISAAESKKRSEEQVRFSAAVSQDFLAQYEAGSRFFLDLLGAQDDLARAKGEGIDARYALLDSEYRLLASTGTLTESLGVAKTTEAVRVLLERRAEALFKDATEKSWWLDPIRSILPEADRKPEPEGKASGSGGASVGVSVGAFPRAVE